MITTCQKMLAFAFTTLQRQQCGLPMWMGGFGLTKASTLAPLALFVSNISFDFVGKHSLGYRDQCGGESFDTLRQLRCISAFLPASFQLPRSWIAEGLPGVMKAEWLHLDFWMPVAHVAKRALLVSQASGRNVVRLQCQQAPSTGAWVTAFPAASLDLEVSNAMYRTMAKFWMGAPLLSNCSSTAICPFCSESADIFCFVLFLGSLFVL